MPNVPEEIVKKLTIIWMTLTSSIFIYGAVGYVVLQKNTVAEPLSQTTLIALITVATTAAIISFVVMPKAMKPKSPKNLLSYCILQWALIEGIAVLGLVLYFLGSTLSTFLVFLLFFRNTGRGLSAPLEWINNL